MSDHPIIDPKNMPMWVAVGFIIALLALALSLTGLYRTHASLALTQLQIISLNKKLDDVSKQKVASAAGAAAAPAAAEPAKK